MSSFVVIDKDGKSSSVSTIHTDDSCLDRLRQGQILTQLIQENNTNDKGGEFRRSSTPPPSSKSLTPEPYHEVSISSRMASPIYIDKGSSVVREIEKSPSISTRAFNRISNHLSTNVKYYISLGLIVTLYVKISDKLEEILRKNEK